LKHLPPQANVSHYCPGDPNPFVAVSTWADDIRVQRPETGPWHFIDLPLGTTTVDPKYCPPPNGCVITAIQRQAQILRNPNAPPEARSLALLFLIHLLGDIHQPLHDTTNNDRGANCLPIAFFGKQPQEGVNESFTPNLHGVWDTGLVERAMAGRSVADFAAYLDLKYPAAIRAWAGQPPNIFNWVLESHKLAASTSYGKLSVQVPVEEPTPITFCSDDNHVGRRLLALHASIDQPYAEATQPTLEIQLVRAGIRLAGILNRTWN
jgi:hypothetical protein